MQQGHTLASPLPATPGNDAAPCLRAAYQSGRRASLSISINIIELFKNPPSPSPSPFTLRPFPFPLCIALTG